MRTAAILLLVLLVPSSGWSVTRRRAVIIKPYPPCSVISGTSAVTFTRDEGRSLAPTSQPLGGTAYTFGLAALDLPDTLLSLHDHLLSISRDAGCNWSAVASIDFADYYPPSIAAASGGRAYIWADHRLFLARDDASVVTALKPPAAIIGLIAERGTNRIRIGGDDGSVWESIDAGGSWTHLGSAASRSGIYYRTAFDPADLDHIAAGVAGEGVLLSRDGGRSWTAAKGLGNGSVNAFNIVFAPSDPRVLWAMGIDIAEADANAASGGRHLYRSVDGGATFAPIVTQDASVSLINGPVMAAHPTNPYVLYFVFGSYFQRYGTDLFRYDASASTLTKTHNNYDGIDAIAFSPSDPDLIYVGLRAVNLAQPAK